MEEIICLNCDKKFNAKKSSNRKYCSHKCSSEYVKRTGSGKKELVRVEVTCQICNKKVLIIPCRVKTFRTCSNKCKSLFNTNARNVKCAWCDLEFHLKPYLKLRSKNHFCSRDCFAHWKKENLLGVKNPNWRDKHSSPWGSKERTKYRRVALDILGLSKIPRGYNIHHRDMNKSNSAPENLVLLATDDHRWLHCEFGFALLNAYSKKLIDKNTICSWSSNEERALNLIDLNILQQSVVLKSGELLGTPEEDNQQPSVENDIKVSTKVQRLESEESTNNLSTSARHSSLSDDIVRSMAITLKETIEAKNKESLR